MDNSWEKLKVAPGITMGDLCRSYAYDGATYDNYVWALTSNYRWCDLQSVAFGLCALKSVLRGRGGEVKINSGIRCPKCNALVGGVINSAHLRGMAIDFTAENVKEVMEVIEDECDMFFDKVIWYRDKNFIHAEINETGKKEIIIRR